MTRPEGFSVMAFVRVPQKILHRQVRLRDRLPHRQRHEKVSGSGRRLIGTQAGVLLEIEKEATAADLSCHVFVVADGIINVVENKLQGVEYYKFLRIFVTPGVTKIFEKVKC